MLVWEQKSHGVPLVSDNLAIKYEIIYEAHQRERFMLSFSGPHINYFDSTSSPY